MPFLLALCWSRRKTETTCNGKRLAWAEFNGQRPGYTTANGRDEYVTKLLFDDSSAPAAGGGHRYGGWPRISLKAYEAPLCGIDARAFGILFQPNLYRSSNGTCRLDQRIELDGQVAGVEDAVQLRPAGGHALGHIHFAEFDALHSVI
jgi:hypothetical protein